MKKRPIITVTVLAVALVATAALAQGPRGLRGERSPAPESAGPQMCLDRLAWLDLGDEQEQAVETIVEKARQEGIELRKQQARLRNAIHGEMLADLPSQTKLVDLTEQLGALRTELQVIRLKARLEVRAQLTEEQRDRLLLKGDCLMGDRRGGDRLGRGGPCGKHSRGDLENRMRMHRHRFLQLDDDGDDEEEEDEEDEQI